MQKKNNKLFDSMAEVIKRVYGVSIIDLPAYQIGIIEHYYKLAKTRSFKEYIKEVIKKWLKL